MILLATYRNLFINFVIAKYLTNLKESFYQTVIRLVTLYDNKCWVLKYQQGQKMMMVEMRMLRYIIEYTRTNKLWNNYIWEKMCITPIEKKIIKTRLQLFGHI